MILFTGSNGSIGARKYEKTAIYHKLRHLHGRHMTRFVNTDVSSTCKCMHSLFLGDCVAISSITNCVFSCRQDARRLILYPCVLIESVASGLYNQPIVLHQFLEPPQDRRCARHSWLSHFWMKFSYLRCSPLVQHEWDAFLLLNWSLGQLNKSVHNSNNQGGDESIPS